jgi:hypothetical protein
MPIGLPLDLCIATLGHALYQIGPHADDIALHDKKSFAHHEQ